MKKRVINGTHSLTDACKKRVINEERVINGTHSLRAHTEEHPRVMLVLDTVLCCPVHGREQSLQHFSEESRKSNKDIQKDMIYFSAQQPWWICGPVPKPGQDCAGQTRYSSHPYISKTERFTLIIF